MIKIGVDLDDVCWDLSSAWLAAYNQESGASMKSEDVLSWEIVEHVEPESRDILFKVLEDSSFWETVHPFEMSQMYLKRLYQDLDLYIITASGFLNLESKMQRFQKLFPFIPEEKIIIAKNKSLINVDVLCDDAVHNLEGREGINILVDRPWNRYFDCDRAGMKRVEGLEGVYNYLVSIGIVEKG